MAEELKLSDRVRPGTEAAPWVVEAIKKLEAQLPSQGGEAVAAQTRFRRPEKGAPDWSPWHETRVSKSQPSWCIDSQGFEVEYRLLYTHPADQVAEGVVVSRELLEQTIQNLMYGSARENAEELRALLDKP